MAKCDEVLIRPSAIGPTPVAQYFPAPDSIDCGGDNNACRKQPLIVPEGTGPEYRASASEIYTLKASAEDTNGKAEIFEIHTALGVQSLWIASAHSDTFFMVARGFYRFTIGLLNSNVSSGQFVYIKKGTSYGYTQLMNVPGLIYGMYLPPGTLGFHAEGIFSRGLNQYANPFDKRLFDKYDIVPGFNIDFRNTVFACKPKWPRVNRAPKKEKLCSPPWSVQRWEEAKQAPIAKTMPEVAFPHYGPNACLKQLPASALYTNASFAAPHYARTDTTVDPTSWDLLVGLTETDKQAEIVILNLLQGTPFEAVYLNADVALYLLDQTTDPTLLSSVTVGTVAYPAETGFFAFVPKGTYFKLSAPGAVSASGVQAVGTATANFVIAYLGGGGTFGYYRNKIQVQNIVDAGTIDAATGAIEIDALAMRYGVMIAPGSDSVPCPPAPLDCPVPCPVL